MSPRRQSERRTRIEIYLDILNAVENVCQEYGLAKPTRVQYQVHLPYDKFARYLRELRNLEMLKADTLEVTEKGHTFYIESKRLLETLSLGRT